MAYAYTVAEERGGARSPAWDAFVDRVPGGHHAQTSLWAQVKASLGWDATRLIARRDGEIVGGVQLLTRGIGRAGAVAFAPRGPVLVNDDPELVATLERAVMRHGRRRGIRYVKLQPPEGHHDVVAALLLRGWGASAIAAAPRVTVRVRIDRPEEAILAGMRKSTRRRIRQADAAGLRVRAGTEADLSTYFALVQATANRQGFTAYPPRYYEAMWRVFGEQGRAQLLVAEAADGRALAATLSVAWGDSVVSKMGGWCGDRRAVHATGSIDLESMRWGQELGMRWFDFDGILPSVAEAVLAGEPLPEEARSGVAAYKLGFGGEIKTFPCALDSSPHRLLRPAVRLTAPRLASIRPMAHRALGRGS